MQILPNLMLTRSFHGFLFRKNLLTFLVKKHNSYIKISKDKKLLSAQSIFMKDKEFHDLVSSRRERQFGKNYLILKCFYTAYVWDLLGLQIGS